MLQHDRHLVRILILQPFRKPDPRCAGLECDEKVMIPGDAALQNAQQHSAHDTALRFQDESLVPDQIFWHSASNANGSYRQSKVAGFCCPAPPAAPNSSYAVRTLIRALTPLARRGVPQHSCRWQLLIWPNTAVPCRAKDYPLHLRRSYFAPIKSRRVGTVSILHGPAAYGGGAGYRPRV